MPTAKEMLVSIEENQRLQLDRCEGCQQKVAKHEATLYGNGSLGLKAKVAIMFWILGAIGTAATIAGAAVIKSAFGL